MVCSKCNFENAPHNRFCGGCGQPLVVVCSACGHENEPRNRFCGQCGHKLDSEAAAEPTPPAPAPTPAPAPERDAPVERRQLTVLFCDLVGSTDLSDRMDPEDLRELVREYQLASSEVIERYGGHIAQYLGDGILVYFGYPRAHEDSPRRALNTGLGIVESIAELNSSIRPRYGLDLAVRVGIHTGSGVVGDVGGGSKREQLLIGRAPNVAARLQGKAKPDEVVVSAVTHALTRNFFSFESLGEHALKGLSEPMQVYRVVSQRRTSGIMDSVGYRGMSPLAGRRDELKALLRRYQSSRQGHGQLALITGDAGLGKSRLVHSLRTQIGHEEATWLTCAASPYAQNSAFYPLIEMFRGLLRITPDRSAAVNLENLEKGLEGYGQLVTEAVPLFAQLLSVAGEKQYETPNLSPQAQRDKTLDLLVKVLLRQAELQPLVFMVEDLHWLDPSTLQFIDTLAEAIGDVRILVVLTYRPSFAERWSDMTNCLRIELEPLSETEVHDLVNKLAQGRPVSDAAMRYLIAKTDGVPLFVEEMTKALLESGFSALDENASDNFFGVPTTLRDALTARLDRMDIEAKSLAQLASAIGRTFSGELLLAVSGRLRATLTRELKRLVDAEIIYQDDNAQSEDSYIFRHALLQDTAYDSMLRSRRREIHSSIARVLAERFPAVVEAQPELLAQHFELADDRDQAVAYLERAGQRAIARSAYLEAISQLSHAIEVLGDLPESAERSQREIRLRLALGGGLIATKGYAAPEVQDNYSRAQELCRGLENTVQLIPVLYGLIRRIWRGGSAL
ncbi:MAG: adenylate/guanylate cyclase domain-containing protein [Myxococcota bacterium]